MIRNYPLGLSAVALLVLLIGPALALDESPGALAEREMRALASQFPGRMAGTAQERAAAEHLAERFAAFGYTPTLQAFPARYSFHPMGGGQPGERDGVSHNVVAELSGRSDRLVIIGAHYDTAVTRSAGQLEAGIGGPELQGLDDNASGVGVVLELAARLAGQEPEHTIRFVAFGAEETGLLGARHAVASLSAEARSRVVLMINIDSIITGDRLYVHAGPATYALDPGHAWARERALALAADLGIELTTNPGLNPDYPAGTGCCSDQMAFDEAGIPVMNLEATNWQLGDLDGYQQTEISPAFPAGDTWHQARLDRIDYLESHLPAGRLSERPAQAVTLLLKLIEEAAGLPR